MCSSDLDSDVLSDTQGELRFDIEANDPLSACQQVAMASTLARTGWQVRTEVTTRLRADADRFLIDASLAAWEDGTEVFRRSWQLEIPRDHQ